MRLFHLVVSSAVGLMAPAWSFGASFAVSGPAIVDTRIVASDFDHDGLPDVYALAGDTDGVDGAEDIAGAIATPDTLARAAALGISAKASLANNDGHGFFGSLGDQVITGPTRTNVNDFRAILITPQT